MDGQQSVMKIKYRENGEMWSGHPERSEESFGERGKMLGFAQHDQKR